MTQLLSRSLHKLSYYLLVLTMLGLASTVQAQKGQFTVVIDAGHGGKDPGATGYGYKEKDIALAVALKLGNKIKANHSAVRVLYTRDKDVFVGLQARADFANKNKASLFISIHLNSAGKASSVYGTETYIIGTSKISSNLSVAMRENKAMLLESDYKTTYRGFDPTDAESYIIFDMMQEGYIKRSKSMADYIEAQYRRNGRSSRGVKQEGLWVLSQSAMPSILTEIGFISNASEAHYLGSEEGQTEVANALSKAFSKFYGDGSTSGRERSESHDDSITAPAEESPSTKPISRHDNSPSKEQKSKGKELYRIQFMSDRAKLDTDDTKFKPLKQKVHRERQGSLWLYTVGNTKSLSEAKDLLRSIKKKYPDSFIVLYKGSERIGRL